MKIAIDTSPFSTGHAVRGVGFYLRHLLDALQTYFPEHEYISFNGIKNIPKIADVIHFPYFEPFSYSFKMKSRKNIVYTVHDLTPIVLSSLFPVGTKGKMAWFFQKRTLRSAGAILTDSDSSKKDIVRLANVPEEKVICAYLAADKRFTPIADKSRLKLVKNKYKLPDTFALYVGDVTPNKNLPALVKACLLAEVHLVLAGKALTDTTVDLSHPWTKDLKEVRSIIKDNPTKVTLLGFVPDEDVVCLYNLASVFAMPSLYEGFGLPVVEAMASGCTVVTSNKGSLAEVAGDAAAIIDPSNVENIADTLKRVVTDEKFAKSLREKGLRQSKKFSWQKTAEDTIKAYTFASSI